MQLRVGHAGFDWRGYKDFTKHFFFYLVFWNEQTKPQPFAH